MQARFLPNKLSWFPLHLFVFIDFSIDILFTSGLKGSAPSFYDFVRPTINNAVIAMSLILIVI